MTADLISSSAEWALVAGPNRFALIPSIRILQCLNKRDKMYGVEGTQKL